MVPAFAVDTAAAVAVAIAVDGVVVAAIVVVGNTAAGCTLSDLHLSTPGRVVVVGVVAAAAKWSIVAQRVQ